MRLEKERALERESRGVYTTNAIARKYRLGEITFEELLAAINNGKVWDEPVPPLPDNATWDEIEEHVVVNPRYFLGLPPEQDRQIRLAWSRPSHLNLPIPNYDE